VLLSPWHERGKKSKYSLFLFELLKDHFFRKTSEFTVRPKIPFLTFPSELKWSDRIALALKQDWISEVAVCDR